MTEQFKEELREKDITIDELNEKLSKIWGIVRHNIHDLEMDPDMMLKSEDYDDEDFDDESIDKESFIAGADWALQKVFYEMFKNKCFYIGQIDEEVMKLKEGE